MWTRPTFLFSKHHVRLILQVIVRSWISSTCFYTCMADAGYRPSSMQAFESVTRTSTTPAVITDGEALLISESSLLPWPLVKFEASKLSCALHSLSKVTKLAAH
jgi:hypothetical protein